MIHALMQDMRRMMNVGVFHVIILVIGLRGMGFLQQIVLTRVFLPSTLGQAIYILRMMMLLAVAADLGIHAAVLKYVAEPIDAQGRMDLYKTGIIFSLACSTTFAMLYALVLLVIALLGYEIDLHQEFLFMALYLPVISLSKVPPVFMQACKQIKKASNVAIVTNCVRIAFVVVGAYFFGLWGYLAAMVIGLSVSVVIFLAVTYRPLLQGLFRRSLFGKLVHFGFFSLLANFSGLANASAGIFLLRWMGCADEVVAIFGIATFVNLAVRIFPASLLRAAFPYLSNHRHDPTALIRKVNELSKKEGVVVLAISAFIAATGMWLIPLLFGEFYVASYWPVVLLLVATVCWSVAAPFGHGLFVTDHVRVNFLVAVVSLAVNVGMCFLLIPTFEAIGAAGAISISCIVSSAGTILWGRKLMGQTVLPGRKPAGQRRKESPHIEDEE